MSAGVLEETIDCIYDAALDPERWPEALSRTADACSAVGALIANDDFVRPERAFLWLGRLAPELYEDYAEVYMPTNPWAVGATHLKPHTVTSFDTLVPARELRRSAFYADVLRPQGILHCICETSLRTPTGALAAAVVRSPKAGPAQDEDLTRFGLLSGHLSRAARLSLRIGDSAARQDSLERAFDVLAHGVVLVDAAARPIWANRAADRILTGNDGLTVAQNALRAGTPAATRTLTALVMEAIGRRAGSAALRLERPSLQEPYVVFAAPLPPARLWPGATQAAAIVIITDPLAGNGAEAGALLGTIYGLTPAEARIALLVAAGQSLPEVAAALKVSPNTAHTHLQRVFRKTGARRQADLARIAGSLPKLAAD